MPELKTKSQQNKGLNLLYARSQERACSLRSKRVFLLMRQNT
jgi:hypothetical protein